MKDWVLNWFHNRTGIAIEELLAQEESNFIEQGFVDSFGFLELVSECEQNNPVEFRDEDFSSEIFYTIKGFSETAEARKK